MQMVTIPFDYDNLPATSQAAIIPICIARDDDEGKQIAWDWFEAVARIPDRILALARRYLRDPWCASEIAEGAVHQLWRLHGCEFGRRPEGRLYARASWYAKDLQAGSWRERRGVVTGLEDLEIVVRNRILVDPANYAALYHGQLDYDAFGDQLDDEGLEDVRQMLDFLRDGATWDEVGERMGRSADAARMRFHRKTAGIARRGPRR
jgi:hypothetical protein